MFSRDFMFCQIHGRRVITPLRYKKFLCYSYYMYSRFRHSEFFCGVSHGASSFNHVVCNCHNSLGNILFQTNSPRALFILNSMPGVICLEFDFFVYIHNEKVFITCYEKETISRLHAGKVFKIENGKAVD